jgi:SAM-dependent methyltransferase
VLAQPSGPDSPRPVVREKQEYIPSSDQEAFIVPLLREAVVAELERLNPTFGALVLDAGCGEQPFKRILQSLGWSYTSLDVQQNYQGTVDIVTALDAPLPANSPFGEFQLVLCLEVLEHVFDWPTAISNLAAYLAPGGTLLLTAPFVYELHEEPYDFWRPTPHALAHAVEKAGLQVMSQHRLGDGWDVLGTVMSTMAVTPHSGGLRHRAGARLLERARISFMKALLARRPSRAAALNSRYYLSNVLVATKHG